MRPAARIAAFAAGLSFAAPSAASLTTSESDQIRGYVVGAAHADRVRALIARPDLTADESSVAMTSALRGVALVDRQMTYLTEMVRGAPTPETRRVLAVATVRALLTRVDAIYDAHAVDLERAAGAVSEVAKAYDFAATVVSDAAATDAERADIGRALGEHASRNESRLRVDVPATAPIARLRAQVAVSRLDALPEGATRAIDAADALKLRGARRSALVDRGLLILDRTGSDDRVAQVRPMLDRMPHARERIEAVYVNDDPPGSLRARGGIAYVPDVAGALSDVGSPWDVEADPPPVPAMALEVARGLAAATLAQAFERRPDLRAQVDHDGGMPGVVTTLAMLAVDAPRTLDVASARLIAGHRESAGWLVDALGVLAAFAPASDAQRGLVLPLGAGTVDQVALDANGSVRAFRLDGHPWRFDRDVAGAVSEVRRDGSPVSLSMLPTVRVQATDGSSWSDAGLVFARLAGHPRVAIASGPTVRLVGASVVDSVTTPAPGDDVVLEADLAIDGAPAGVVFRALPTPAAFRGVSVLVVPGSPAHAVLLFADGGGAETAASPVVDVPPARSFHVLATLKGQSLAVAVGPTTLSFSIPDRLLHGDVALRAYPNATLHVSGWRLSGGGTDGAVARPTGAPALRAPHP